MTLLINGAPQETADDTTLAALLAALGHDPSTVACALNQEFVARADYATRILAEGDEVEIVSPMQGG